MDYSSKLGELNKKYGLVICGKQGGANETADDDKRQDEIDSQRYFSTLKHREGKSGRGYVKEIVKWFGLWEHPLETEESKITGFEKSIIGIEWLDGHAKITPHSAKDFAENSERILGLLKDLEPKMLFFFGANMFDALDMIRPQAEEVLGKALKEPEKVGKAVFQKFENCQVISLPHTASTDASHSFIESLKPKIKPLIDEYRKSKGV
ncbi:hypothetical protein [Helicobacter cetorum]|uniref:hypothetical protein n=1 Tax=Helicobacter cetorum TaxID=138563 RepID=UPI000CF09911|nr:hypothetical protein [Helicobacter cetorum]